MSIEVQAVETKGTGEQTPRAISALVSIMPCARVSRRRISCRPSAHSYNEEKRLHARLLKQMVAREWGEKNSSRKKSLRVRHVRARGSHQQRRNRWLMEARKIAEFSALLPLSRSPSLLFHYHPAYYGCTFACNTQKRGKRANVATRTASEGRRGSARKNSESAVREEHRRAADPALTSSFYCGYPFIPKHGCYVSFCRDRA